MHRMIVAAVAASALSAAGAAHAGWSSYGSYDGGYGAQPCGCQGGYDQSGDWGSSYQDYDETPYYEGESEAYMPSYRYESYGYRTPAYGYGYQQDRSYEEAPRYRRYTRSYDDDSGYRSRHAYGYHRTYRYTAPRYRSRYTGHSSVAGERG